jgi:flavin reductase (DIM6/NTAB) family NADH-FMN oxidoreductase RutF
MLAKDAPMARDHPEGRHKVHDMPPSPRAEPTPLALALGRIPSGLFILTTSRGEHATGMLASWVQQAGFEPPMLTVAIRRDRFIADWIADSRRFTLNQVIAHHKPLLRHFARGFEPNEPAFDGLELRHDAEGGPILADALAFLDCAVVDELVGPDHRIFLAQVVAGALLHSEAEPMIHVRHNGMHY